MDTSNNSTLIELHIDDFEKAISFYSKLGFKVAWKREPEGFKGYLVMKMRSNVLCFWGGNDEIYNHPYFQNYPKDTKRGYGVELVITVEDIHEFYSSLPGDVKIVEELSKKPWGLEDFRIEDPFGYYVRITTDHDILDPKYAVK